uniref:Small ribosomal subunit protein uS4c n=1 Tax=Scherffelia dubia TaxID=3190 RepID=A0A142BYB0_SCHDU|nr:ribosomal protein S4 [Scherffelia dubia]AMP43402.1 ribosomal protein S4 [Scherffelia dubia]
MARYRGPRVRIIRRLGELPGLTQKTTKRQNPPGQHVKSKWQMMKLSQYNLRLQEKQKLRYHFGLSENQLLNYVKRARQQKGASGQLLLELLEMRLDNLLFRLGMAPTISAARQFISHGHVLVNSKKVDIPSYQCEPKDIISIKQKKESRKLIADYLEQNSKQKIAPHLSLNPENLIGIVNDKVNSQSLGLNINELLIVEYYSRKV